MALKKGEWVLYTVSFIEGGSLMAVEILGAKWIMPYYGNSVYVWAAVLATTLGGLALGYYFGGKLSKKEGDKSNYLLKIILSSAVICFLIPFYAPLLLDLSLNLSLKTGIVISSFFILTPALFCFGVVSPLIIQILTDAHQNLGKISGTIYAISTLGGVAFTIFFGLYMIPFIGVKTSTFIVFALMFGVAVLYFLTLKKLTKIENQQSA